jgi:hypothetical protein
MLAILRRDSTDPPASTKLLQSRESGKNGDMEGDGEGDEFRRKLDVEEHVDGLATGRSTPRWANFRFFKDGPVGVRGRETVGRESRGNGIPRVRARSRCAVFPSFVENEWLGKKGSKKLR